MEFILQENRLNLCITGCILTVRAAGEDDRKQHASGMLILTSLVLILGFTSHYDKSKYAFKFLNSLQQQGFLTELVLELSWEVQEEAAEASGLLRGFSLQ